MSEQKFLQKIKEKFSKPDQILIQKALDFSRQLHAKQKRLSGEPFLVHPFCVAKTLLDLGLDAPTIAAGLLHDSIEDAGISQEELSREFGKEVASLVEGVTKLGRLVFESKEQRQAENFRKMLLAMGEDLRIIIIKLADRLHNMQTLSHMPSKKQWENAEETREIFAPLAHRLGMWRLKWELEDLSFRYLEPDHYDLVAKKVSASRKMREKYISLFIEEVVRIMDKMQVKAQVYGRPKHFSSIFRKMQAQNLSFEELYDLYAIRILVDSVQDCYAVLGTIHAHFKPVPGRFRDYIAMPKSNGYQSLHTTVIGFEGRPFEVQIRTQEMHRTAEYGIAAHWKYKEKITDKKFDQKIAWLRQLLETQGENKDPRDFIENLKIDLFEEEIFVFTPKGEVINLPMNATPIDFAYRVHTEIGHRCIGAKINGRIVPLEAPLKSGDFVEILTAKNNSPRMGWLSFAKTSGARSKIKAWFKKQKPQAEIVIGEESIQKKSQPASARKKKKAASAGVRVEGLDNVMVHFSRCCAPIPGEDIVGFVTRGRGVAIHRIECQNLLRQKKAEKDRLIKVSWEKDADFLYPVEIEIEAFDRVGVLKDILAQIAEIKTNVAGASVKTKRGSTAIISLTVDIKNTRHLNDVINEIKKVSDVYRVMRCA